MLQRSSRTANPPKLVLYGDWGVGKTHTMRHMQYEIENNPDYAAEVVFVELPDITKKTDFQAAQSSLLDALGLDRVKVWISQFQAKNPNALELMQEWTQSADIARAFTTLIGYGEAARIAWDWLRGLKLSPADARSAGLPPSLDQSLHMVQVLRALGRLSQDIEGKMLVLMLDEATKVKDVGDYDARAHWKNALKELADDLTQEVGFVASISMPAIEDFPEPFRDQQIITRFGEDHYIELPTFFEDDARTFLDALVGQWVNADRKDALLLQYASEADGEEIDGSFPFTVPGLERFTQYVTRSVTTTPRDIQKTLDDFLNRAMDVDRHILSRSFVESLTMAG
jgi:Cdc6-like AAA superfamily ATPase